MTLTPNMSIYVPTNGQQLFSAAFLAGMQNIDAHGHTGAPNDGVPLGTNGIQDGAITPDKLSFTLFDQESIQTTDATPTTISAITVVDSHTVTIQGILAGIRSNGLESLGGNFSGTFYKPAGGGAVLQVGTPVINFNDDFSGAPTFDFNVTATEVQMRCTGEAGKTIVWTVQFSYIDRDTSL